MKKIFVSFLTFISLSITYDFVCGAELAISLFKYTKEINFAPLSMAHPPKVSNWVHKEGDNEYAVHIKLENFFQHGSPLTIACLKKYLHNQRTSIIRLFKDDKEIVVFDNIPPIGTIRHPFPVRFYDFDNNGLNDLRLVFYSGGNSGNWNNGQTYYLFQHKNEWQLISFFIRDISYSWEVDLDGDGRYEILKGHHQDKRKPGYHDPKNDKWVSEVFRKYLFINAYSVSNSGLTLCNNKSRYFPKILPFRDDPFNVCEDKDFLEYNQFKVPHRYLFTIKKIN